MVADVFVDRRTHLTKKINEESIRDLSLLIVKWIEEDERIVKMPQIYAKLGILPMDFYRIKEKYEDLQHAYQFGLMLLGIRRELKGLENEMNPGMISYTMAHYDDVWKELAEWRAQLQAKNQQQQSASNFVIQMNPIQDSSLVPVKKSESVTVEKEDV